MPNEIALNTMPVDMDSREIAELTGKSHSHVLRDISAMLSDLGVPRSTFGSGYQDAQNQTRPCFKLPKRECLILIGGYSTALRARVVDRWIELETAFQRGGAANLLEDANARFERLVDSKSRMIDRLGFSQGFLRAEALKIATHIHRETGIQCAPDCLLSDPQANNPSLQLSAYEGTHAALVAIGNHAMHTTAIARTYNHRKITATVINKLLCSCGYQIPLVSRGHYAPTDRATGLCNTHVLQSGSSRGSTAILTWQYNTSSAFARELDQAVLGYLASLEV